MLSTRHRDGTGSRVTGSSDQRLWPGRVGSRVSVSDPVFDSILCFNVRVYRVVVTPSRHNFILVLYIKAQILTTYPIDAVN